MPEWKWPDARGWIGIGAFVLTVMVLWMLKEDVRLREDEFFKILATLIVSGFAKDVLGWAYSATKGGGELADKNAAIVSESAAAGVKAAKVVAEKAAASLPDPNKPQPVIVENPPENPAHVTDKGAAQADPPDEDLPEYAR